jgi:hypothetical protein
MVDVPVTRDLIKHVVVSEAFKRRRSRRNDVLLVTDSVELRAEARDVLASRDEALAISIFSTALDDQKSEITEKQRAIASLA